MFARVISRTIRPAIAKPNGFTNFFAKNLQRRWFAAAGPEKVSITFSSLDKSYSKTVKARVGGSLLDAAHENDIDVEGACGGQCACSTCHMYIAPENLKDLAEPDDDEMDMLDLALGVEDNSRLGCQIRVTKDMDGWVISLPEETSNILLD